MVYLAKSTFWINSNTVVVSILSFLLYMAFARFLPKENYGTYQFILSIGSIIGAFTLTGMNTAITQAVARGLEGSFKKSILIQLKYGLIPFLVSIGISTYYFINNNWQMALGVLIIGILTPLINTFNTFLAFLNGKKDFESYFYLSQILNFIYYPILIFSLVLTKNPVVIVSINLILNFIANLIAYFIVIKKYQPNNQEDPETISYGKHLSLANFISTAILQLDNILVFHYLGAAELAIYAFATNIPDRVYGVIKSIQTITLPKLAVQNKKNIKNNVHKKTINLLIISFVFAILYIILAPTFYKLFFSQYIESIFYSQIYILVLITNSLVIIPGTALLATKSKKEVYIANTICSLFFIFILFFMIKKYGIFGLILAKGISGLFNYILANLLIKRI
ncbi:MAG: oligosaccharide flippase family protein [Minisyncoccota bacterium]